MLKLLRGLDLRLEGVLVQEVVCGVRQPWWVQSQAQPPMPPAGGHGKGTLGPPVLSSHTGHHECDTCPSPMRGRAPPSVSP